MPRASPPSVLMNLLDDIELISQFSPPSVGTQPLPPPPNISLPSDPPPSSTDAPIVVKQPLPHHFPLPNLKESAVSRRRWIDSLASPWVSVSVLSLRLRRHGDPSFPSLAGRWWVSGKSDWFLLWKRIAVDDREAQSVIKGSLVYDTMLT